MQAVDTIRQSGGDAGYVPRSDDFAGSAPVPQCSRGREASLQRALDDVTVQEARGTGDEQHSLADHLRMLGIDPAGVMAVSVDDQGVVAVYYQ